MKINTLKGLIAKANRIMDKQFVDKDEKKLIAVIYCGPNKSFPITNCEYVAVSEAYLGKSKLSETSKQIISRCISKKAIALGCATTNKARAGRKYPIYIELSYVQKQLYMSSIFKATRDLVDDSLATPGMELNCVNIVI